MKATARAPANIALVKYWGKTYDDLRLPVNSSISMNLSGAYTVTTVEFSYGLEKDDISTLGGEFSDKEKVRIGKHLDRIRERAKIPLLAKVVTQNTFPKGIGAASSASGFAALTLAGTKSIGLTLTEKELTVLARIGSGSACRSIPDGIVEWKAGATSKESYAYSMYPSAYWNLCDVLVIVDAKEKKVSTTEGMEKAATSPFFLARIKDLPNTIQTVKEALKEKDFENLGQTIESEAINMHAVMMTQDPALFYWNSVTLTIIHSIHKWRENGIAVYFTIDAGPNVHLICEAQNATKVEALARMVPGVEKTLLNRVSVGANLIHDHLF